MITCRGVRSNRRRAVALLLGVALAVTNNPTISLRVSAQAPVGAGFVLDANDLRFIYQQILIAQNHARPGGTIEIAEPRLPFGLRTVDGSFNHLDAGDTTFGASGQVFPRRTASEYRDAEPLVFDPDGPGPQTAGEPTSYAQKKGAVSDSTPRLISNLIVDQTATNPAAVAVAGPDAEVDAASGTIFIPNVAPDVGLSAPKNTMFVFFGQFFDHGLDLIDRGNQPVFMPLRPDDPLIPGPDGVLGNDDDLPPQQRFMVITRARNQPGPDGVVGDDPATPDVDESLDDVREATNRTTSFVDQQQTYTSNPSHQVFLREYSRPVVDAVLQPPVATGQMLHGANGNIGTWADVKAQARTMLGIDLVDTDVFNVPMVAVDPYGRYLRGPNGFAQLVTAAGLVEGNPAAPISTAAALRVGQAFLDDIAHEAVPDDSYDVALLDAHFATGDGRGNENIALTAVHTVFHNEHNRLALEIGGVNGVGGLIDTLLTPEEAQAWRAVDGPSGWDYGERVFQAARFVTEMQYQHLVFEEFGRSVSPSINEFIGDGINFQTSVNPAIVAEFAHAVYRFGHSMLTETISRELDSGEVVDIPLLDGFLNPHAFNTLPDGRVLDARQAAGAIFRGGVRQIANEIDEFKTEALRNRLLGLPLDLAAINIARGRAEGVAPLNHVRAQLYAATNDPIVRPYDNWADFAFSMRFPQSLPNFIAAYGNHPTINAEPTVAGKRAAAQALVDSGDMWLFDPAADTGLNTVDLWMGGLAEKVSPFGGLLGSTFNNIFELQLENLQNADRFYYLERLDGLNLLVQMEANSFAEIIKRNTTAGTNFAGDVFGRPDFVINMSELIVKSDNPTLFENDPTGGDLRRMPDGTVRYIGAAHVIFNGTSGDDLAFSSEGDDTFNGGDGNDRWEGGAGNDTPIGGNGDDILVDFFGEDVIKGGPGNDAINGGMGLFDLLQGNADHDFIVGGNDVSEIFGGSGNDVIYTGDGATESFGGAGNDWLESGNQLNLLVGDENNQFQNDPSQGHDIITGGFGDDDFDSEGGDDIMDASKGGTDRLEGMLGFDFVTYPRAFQPVNADMSIRVVLPPNLDELRDRFDLVEGLSGSPLDDILSGDDNDAAAQLGHELTEEGSARITGLRDVLRGATTFTGGNIILGGAGSDQIEGAGGNDVIDGDAWLNVRLQATLNDGTVKVATTLHELRNDIFANPQRLNPGNITFLREITTIGAQPGDVDIAFFSGPRADYTIEVNADGTVTVSHLAGTGLDGTDTVRNIELLRFADVDVSTAGAVGGVTVPNLFGLTEEAARAAILNAGFNVGIVNGPTAPRTHPTAAVGSVIDQSPLGTSLAAIGTEISFSTSLGALVPDIHESSVEDGTAVLVAGGLVVSGQTSINDPEIPVGFVASTNPPAGAIVPPGSNVLIHVSLGPVAAGRVPAVAGMLLADAEEAIVNAGFALPATPNFEVSATIPAGSVTRTQPAAGLARAAGTVVTPVVSLGADGLALALSFDEPGGTTAFDSSSTAQVGTLRQATMVRAPGRFGNAVVFDGVNDWVTVTDTTTSPLDLRNAMTIEAWVNPSSVSGWETVVMKERAGGLAYALYAHDGAPLANGVAAPAGYNNVSGDQGVQGTSPIPLNTWTHLAMTYDGANQRLYVNGVEVASRPLTGLNIQNNNALRIGGNNQFPGEFFNGMIDEVRVFMSVRTAAQIQSDMNTPINPQ